MVRKEKHKFKKLLYSQKIAPFVFICPFILSFLIFWLFPLMKAGVMSMQTVLPGATEYVGTKNYEKLMGDIVFRKAVANSIKYMIGTLLILIPIPMVLAYMINSKMMRGREVFKSILFVPALTSVVVAGTIFSLMFGETAQSFMNQLIDQFGAGPLKWLKNSTTSFIALYLLASWRWLGVNMLYFIAGLSSIPEDLYESASIDGAKHGRDSVTYHYQC